MPMVRVCPQCGVLNGEAKGECRRCGAPTSMVEPVDSASLPEDALQAGSVATGRDALAASRTAGASAYRDETAPPPAAGVVVTGIEVPFLDLVILLVKLAIAAIPALIVVALFWAVVSGVVAGVFAGAR